MRLRDWFQTKTRPENSPPPRFFLSRPALHSEGGRLVRSKTGAIGGGKVLSVGSPPSSVFSLLGSSHTLDAIPPRPTFAHNASSPPPPPFENCLTPKRAQGARRGNGGDEIHLQFRSACSFACVRSLPRFKLETLFLIRSLNPIPGKRSPKRPFRDKGWRERSRRTK